MATLSKAFELILKQAPNFDGREASWTTWSFKLESLLSLAAYEARLDAAAASTSELVNSTMSEEHQLMSKQLYHLLVATCSGKALLVIRAVPKGAGFEAWRKLKATYEPRTGGRFASMLGAVLSPTFTTVDAFLQTELSQWEQLISRYETEAGEKISDAVKVATVLRTAPKGVLQLLRLTVQDGRDYNAMRTALENYRSTTASYSPMGVGEVVPMEVDFIGKGGRGGRGSRKGDGRGKGGKGSSYPGPSGDQRSPTPGRPKGAGKGKAGGRGQRPAGSPGSSGQAGGRFAGECHRCGRSGHRARDCVAHRHVEGQMLNQLAMDEHHMPSSGNSGSYAPSVTSASETHASHQPHVLTVRRVMSVTHGASAVGAGGIEHVLVDSGAYDHVAPPSFAPHIPLERESNLTVRKVTTASGDPLEYVGVKRVPVYLEGGVQATVRFEILRGLSQPILSVMRLCQNDWRVEFGEESRLLSGDAVLSLVQKGGMWYLPLQVEKIPKRVRFQEVLQLWQERESQQATRNETRFVSPVDAEPHEPQEVQEAQPARPGRIPAAPTPEERAKHELTHIPYRAWCASCVRGRAKSDPHRRRDIDPDFPEIQIDYCFVKTSDDQDVLRPVLAAIHVQSGYVLAQPLASKAVKDDRRALTCILEFIQELGLTGSELTLHTDGEAALCALCDQVAIARRDVRTHIRHGAPGSSQSQGAVERWIQTLKGQVRTLLVDIELRYGTRVLGTSLVTEWAIRQSAWIWSRFNLRPDGRTPFHHVKGAPYASVIFPFLQYCMAREPEATSQDALEPRWRAALWLTRSPQTDEHVVWTEAGLLHTRSVRAMPEISQPLFAHLSGAEPEAPRPGRVLLPEGSSPQSSGSGDPSTPSKRHPAQERIQRFWADCGRTVGCHACMYGPKGRVHSSGCLKRQGDWGARAIVRKAYNEGRLSGEAAAALAKSPAVGPAGPRLSREPSAGHLPTAPAATTAAGTGAGQTQPSGPGAAGGNARSEPSQPAVPSSLHVEASSTAGAGELSIPMDDTVVDKRSDVGHHEDESPSKRLRAQQPNVERFLHDDDDMPLSRAFLTDDDMPLSSLLNISKGHESDEPVVYDDEEEMAEQEVGRAVSVDLRDPEQQEAMRLEVEALESFDVFRRVSGIGGDRAITGRWVITRKPNGTLKARMVAREYATSRDDSGALYAPASSPVTLRLLLSVALQRRWELRTADVSTAFLHAPLPEPVLFRPPPPFTNELWELSKALYGLRASPRHWHDHLTEVLREYGLKQCRSDPTLYHNQNLLLVTHVDDFMVAGSSQAVAGLFNYLGKKLKFKETGVLGKDDWVRYLGIQYLRPTETEIIAMVPETYITETLSLANLEHGKSLSTPAVSHEAPTPDDIALLGDREYSIYRRVLGRLTWMSPWRPDVQFAVKELARRASSPDGSAWKAMKRLLRYLVGTPNVFMKFNGEGEQRNLIAQSDANWAPSGPTWAARRSTTGGVILFGGNLVASWSRTQQVTALSSCESELYALCTAGAEALKAKYVLSEIMEEKVGVVLQSDASSTIQVLLRSVTNRLKHVETRAFWLRGSVQSGSIQLEKVAGSQNVADGLTKPLGTVHHQTFFDRCTLVCGSATDTTVGTTSEQVNYVLMLRSETESPYNRSDSDHHSEFFETEEPAAEPASTELATIESPTCAACGGLLRCPRCEEMVVGQPFGMTNEGRREVEDAMTEASSALSTLSSLMTTARTRTHAPDAAATQPQVRYLYYLGIRLNLTRDEIGMLLPGLSKRTASILIGAMLEELYG